MPWDDEADYVVIGTGPGGATAGLELSRRGREVLFLEEGGWFKTEDFRPDLYSSLSRLWRDFGGQAARGRSVFPVAQGCCVGGSTTINGAILHRIPRYAWERWAEDPGIREHLPWDQLDEATSEIQKDLRVRANIEPLLPEIPLSATLQRLGWSYGAMPRAAPECRHTARCGVGCPSGGRLSLGQSFVPWALDLGARLRARCRATQILVEKHRGAGVEAVEQPPGEAVRTVRVRARRGVVVAAGAIHSPLLLRASGFRSRQIGRHLQCQSGTNIVVEYGRPAAQIEGPAMGYEVHYSPELKFGSFQSAPLEFMLSNVPAVGADLAAMVARSERISLWNTSTPWIAEGTVRRGLLGWPAIRLSPTRSDLDRMRTAAAALSRFLLEAGAVAVFPGVHGAPPRLERVQDAELINSAPLDARNFRFNCSHIFGTCRMASNPRQGVVDTRFRMHEADGIYVVDASVFPTTINANPQQAIMTLARHAARHFLT